MTARATAPPENRRAADRAGSTARKRAPGQGAPHEDNTLDALREAIAELVRVEVARALADREAADAGAELLTVSEAARRIAMSESFIRAAIRDGRLPAQRLGRSVRLQVGDVEALPTRRRSSSTETPGQRAQRILAGGRR